MYITYPTQGGGARPSQAQPPAATRLATPNADQCVHLPREGRERNRQTPPKKKQTNKQHRRGKKTGGGARDRQTAAKPGTHSKRGDRPPSQAKPKATPTGPPERTPEDRPAKPSKTQPKAAAKQRKGHPGHAGTHPTGEVAGRKKKWAQPKRKGKGGRRLRDPRSG